MDHDTRGTGMSITKGVIGQEVTHAWPHYTQHLSSLSMQSAVHQRACSGSGDGRSVTLED